MRAAIGASERIVAIAQVSSTLMPSYVAADQVLDAMLVVFALDDYGDFAFLSSDVHRLWAVKYGTTMRTDARYTPSTIFDTLPRPQTTEDMRNVGERLDGDRREIMLRRGLGLTPLYNRVNSPDIRDDVDVDLVRAMHVEIDKAVIDAYGWTDIPLDHGFHTYRQAKRWTVSPAARVEILDRLLEENHRRAAIEAQQNPRKAKLGMSFEESEQPEGAMF